MSEQHIIELSQLAKKSQLKLKLRNSITYLISHGHFNQSRFLIEHQATNLNETDEWWLLEPSITNISKLKKKYSSSAIDLVNSPKSDTSKKRIVSLNQQHHSNVIRYGRTALMYCSLIESDTWAYSIAQNLIEKGAKQGIKDSFNFNALMYACFYERYNLIELFLNSPGDYSLSSKDNYGNTCFHIAALSKTDKICSILNKLALKFNYYPNLDSNKNMFGHKPIDLCLSNQHEFCLKNFQSNKKSINDNLVNLIPMIRILNDESDIGLYELNLDQRLIDLNLSTKKSTTTTITTTTTTTPSTRRSFILYNNLDSYRFILNQKEPLIKEFHDLMEQQHKIKSDYINFNKRHHQAIQKKCIVTRNMDNKAQYELIKQTRQRTVSEKRQTAYDFDFSKPWRQNLKNLFETLEFQNSRSFRKTNTNLSVNLFEQLTTGLFLNIHLNACLTQDFKQNEANSNNRRNSVLMRGKLQSQLSNNSNDKQKNADAQSVTSAITNANKNFKQSTVSSNTRRTSVMSIK